ncbi:DEAD/DEAH box helicase [Helicobacter sp. NHP21005]|uniref:DEAD/DEAH box helicase n=1 Tax=Helicobacter felistomachi TaxID=3040201 RepID=UPI002572D6D7|nr:AAA domain-containing protein [Helicobacter sp. NHP21005]BEG57323.1 DEAD/DEAH box helicase [Helicobacter sp. NHP21005]
MAQNLKENILDAYTIVEHLGEGDIDKRDKKLKPLGTLDFELPDQKDYKQYFLNELQAFKDRQKIQDDRKMGLVCYFGIFAFEEIVQIFREKYNIQAEDDNDDIVKGDKFSLALVFDKDLSFVEDKTFYTMSAYVRENGDLTEDMQAHEKELKHALQIQFEEQGFDATFLDLCKKYKVDKDNFRFVLLKNIDTELTNLHSFFIKDLQIAKSLNNKNLTTYFSESNKAKKNCDSESNSPNFNPSLFHEILAPKNYPLGRFVADSKYALSFMQQVALNIALDENNEPLRSVNGPPGTGKTTLLKDVFAELVVRQAYEIVQLKDKTIKSHVNCKLSKTEMAELGLLPENIADKNILVASSNNGAVQNIVKELPKSKEIANEFKELAEKIDYFSKVANNEIKDDEGEQNWGLFALEGGASANVKKLLEKIEAMVETLQDLQNKQDLKHTCQTWLKAYIKAHFPVDIDFLDILDFQDDDKDTRQDCFDIYKAFLALYHHVDKKRQKMQAYSQSLTELSHLQQEYIAKTKDFESAKTRRKNELDAKLYELEHNRTNIETKKQALTKEMGQVQTHLTGIDRGLQTLEEEKRVLESNKPGFFARVLGTSSFRSYSEREQQILTQLDALNQQKGESRAHYSRLATELQRLQALNIDQEQQSLQENFNRFVSQSNKDLENLEQRITHLSNTQDTIIKPLDFSLSYEDLQKSNPWFNADFRKLQSQLFLLALGVKKQFLLDNLDNLKNAKDIWGNAYKLKDKENGKELLKGAFHWINLAIPVISTTFASFQRMFNALGKETDFIGNLFIDEAGQAVPQSCVGALFRSQKVMAVGDPSQIKPVLTLHPSLLNLIARKYNVTEHFLSYETSVQSITDYISPYGYQKQDKSYIGIPLWVHRRCNSPMFDISNAISYDGLMVQGKDKAHGKAQFYDVKGRADNKFVPEQANFLKGLIGAKLQENQELKATPEGIKDKENKDAIYVISPFRNVAFKLAESLKDLGFKHKRDVGTVHTFQGKEAKIVYFVLGADENSKGAAAWAVGEPNIVNVAATRAKEEFYIIGDRDLYQNLGVMKKTIEVIEDCSKRCP